MVGVFLQKITLKRQESINGEIKKDICKNKVGNILKIIANLYR
jgi:hypothetical protein